jgi:high mobility group protein B1
VAKLVSKAWKELSGEEKEVWEEIARKDKARYEMEKSMYKGPWKVQAKRKFLRKDHEAPTRPMPGYLSFSNDTRAEVKAQYPFSADSTSTTEISSSRILEQQMCLGTKQASEQDERKEHVLDEENKADIAEWNRVKELEYLVVRRGREDRGVEASHDGLQGCLQSRSESPFRGVGMANESEKSKAHLTTYFQGFHGYSGAISLPVPQFYPPAPGDYYTDHYMHHGGHPEYSGEYRYPFYNGGAYADHQSSYSVPSTATAARSEHPICNSGAAYNPTSYYDHQQQTMHPGYAMNYPYCGHAYQYPPEGSHDMYPPQPYAASTYYDETPPVRENQSQEFLEPEPSPLSASRDIFSSSLHGHQSDDSPHHTAREDEQRARSDW